MEAHKTLDSDQHQCYDCKKFFRFAHELQVHIKYRSCISLKLIKDPPVTEELQSKSGSDVRSDTTECDQIITNGLNEPDQNNVLSNDPSRANIFEIFSSAQNPEECCSDFEDHITLDQLKKCVHLTKSANQNKSCRDCLETNCVTPNDLPEGNQRDSLNRDGVKKVVKFKEKYKKLKTFHKKKNLNKTKNKKSKISSRIGEDSVNSDTESATSDLDPGYDKTSDKIPPELIYINGRTYFIDQAVFVKKKTARGVLNAPTATQSSAVCTGASTTVQVEKTDSFLGSNQGKGTQHPADVPSSRDSEAVRSKSEQKSKDCSQVKVHLLSKKNKKRRHLDKQRMITQSKSQHDENGRCRAMSGNKTLRRSRQSGDQPSVVNNRSSKCTTVTKKKKRSPVKFSSNKTADDEDELLRKKVKAVIEEFMKISKSKENSKEKPFTNIRDGPREMTSNQKSLHERSSPNEKEYLPDRDVTETNNSTSNSAVNKDSETIVELPTGEEQTNVERSSSELSYCHLCTTHCEDRAESEASMNLHTDSEPNMCVVCGYSFLFQDSLNHHMETCHKLVISQEIGSNETAAKICKKHQRIIQVIDYAIRINLEPFQKRLERRKLRGSQNVNRCSPGPCIVVEDEDTETCDVLETSLESSCIELLKPYMKIYSDAELLALSSDDF